MHYTMSYIYTPSQKILFHGFLKFFPQWPRILNKNFTRLLYICIYAKLLNFIQLSLTKLCHTECDHSVIFTFYNTPSMYCLTINNGLKRNI